MRIVKGKYVVSVGVIKGVFSRDGKEGVFMFKELLSKLLLTWFVLDY